MMIANDMNAVHAIIKEAIKAPSQALLAFDVDMTLTVPNHPACFYPNMKKYGLALKSFLFFKWILRQLSKVEWDQALTLAMQMSGQQLVEADTPAVIKSLQKQGIKTIAFTASLTGCLEGLGKIEETRFQDLAALDFDFRAAFPQQKILLNEIPAYNRSNSIYDKGILYANGGEKGRNKGAVLVAFLRKVDWKPAQVVMVDDVPKNLKQIKQALAAFDPTIQFVGIEYTGAKTHAPQSIGKRELMAYWSGAVAQIKQAN
jgi:hypothetical protein